jgi:hypothetical protein
VAGAVFLGREDLEGVRRALGNDLTAEGRLEKLELLQGQADDAPVVGVFDFTVLAEGGTQNAVEGGPVLLDFQVDGWYGFQYGLQSGYINTPILFIVKPNNCQCMATSEHSKRDFRPVKSGDSSL